MDEDTYIIVRWGDDPDSSEDDRAIPAPQPRNLNKKKGLKPYRRKKPTSSASQTVPPTEKEILQKQADEDAAAFAAMFE